MGALRATGGKENQIVTPTSSNPFAGGSTLARAVEQVAEGIVITDREGAILYVNPAFSRMTGYSTEESIGQTLRMLRSGKQDPAYYRDLWSTILSGHTWRGDLINRRKDGSDYIEEMTITPVRDGSGEITNFIAIKQDVTERRSAERAQSFLASIVECSEDAIIGQTLDGIIMSWNPAAERLHGYPADEAIGKPVSMLIPPQQLEYLRANLQTVARGESISSFDSIGLTKKESESRLRSRSRRFSTMPEK